MDRVGAMILCGGVVGTGTGALAAVLLHLVIPDMDPLMGTLLGVLGSAIGIMVALNLDSKRRCRHDHW